MNSFFRGNPQSYGELCAPLDITERYELAFRRRHRESDTSISLRPVCLPDDEEFLTACCRHKWPALAKFLTDRDGIEAEKDLLRATAGSSSGQTFVGMINDVPCFRTDIYKAAEYQVINSKTGFFKAPKTDHFLVLNLMPGPDIAFMDDLSLFILKTCLTHYFSYLSVEGILAKIDPNDPIEKELYINAGFRFLQEGEDPYHLYYHAGSGYLDANY